MWTKILRTLMAQNALKRNHCTSGGGYSGASHCSSGETLYRKVGYGHCVTYEPVNRGTSHCG